MRQYSIVVVDDSPLMVQAIEDKLSIYPDLILRGVYHSGRDFLATLSKHKVDLVLMDIEMPEINGI